MSIQIEDTAPGLMSYPFSAYSFSFYMPKHAQSDSMRELTDILHQGLSPEVTSAAYQRKSILGQKACAHLVQCFTRANKVAPRRWSGQFILELIRGSEGSNKKLLVPLRSGIRAILDVLFNESDRCLGIIAAVIIKELATDQAILTALRTIDIRVEKLSTDTGFLLPTGGSQWVKEIIPIISPAIRQPQDTLIVTIKSIYGVAELMDTSGALATILAHDCLTLLSLHDYRFKFFDISLDSINRVLAEGNRMRLCLKRHGYYIINGAKQYPDEISFEMEKSDQVDTAVMTIEKLKGSNCRDIHKTSPYKGRNDGHSATISFENCGGVGEQREELALHESKNPSSDDDTTLWESSYRPPSSAVIELPTGEEVLCESQLFLSSSNPVISQNQHILQGAEPLYEQHKLNQEPHIRDKPEVGGVETINHQHAASPEFSLPTNPLIPVSQRVESLTEEDEVAVLPISPRKFDVAVMDRAAGELGELPNLAKQALLLQRQLSDSKSNPPATSNSSCIEELPGCRAMPVAEEIVVLVPDSQPADGLTTVMADSVTYKSALESGRTGDVPEAGSLNDSRLKRPVHKLCGSSTKKADFDWDEDLRVNTEKPQTRPSVPATSNNSKQTPRNSDVARVPKGRRKPNSTAKKNIKTLKLTPQAGDTSTKQKKRATRQVTKTLTSGRQPRSAAEAASKKMALATERENAAYDLDDPIESSYPGSTSLEDLADHIQLNEENSKATTCQQPSKICAEVGDTAPNKVSSESSGGVAIDHCKEAVADKADLGAPLQPDTQQDLSSHHSEAAESNNGEAAVINLCSDSLLDEDNHQKKQNEVNYAPKVDFSKQTMSCPAKIIASSSKPQSIAKKLATALESMGIAPARQDINSLEAMGGPKTVSSSVGEKKRMTENASQISKNVSQFMSRNLASAEMPGPSSRSLGAGVVLDTIQASNRDGPNTRLAKDNSGRCTVQAGDRPTEAAVTKISHAVAGSGEQQKPARSVKFDLAEDRIKPSVAHSPDTSSTNSSTSSIHYTEIADDKQAAFSPGGDGDSFSLSGIGDNTAFLASESAGDENEELTSSSVHQPTKHGAMEARPIGWQSQTVDENGSPKPRLQVNRNIPNKHYLEALEESKEQRRRACINPRPSVSFSQQLRKRRECDNRSSSTGNPLTKDPNGSTTTKNGCKIPGNLSTGLKRGQQYSYNGPVKTTDIFHPKATIHRTKRSNPAALTQDKPWSLLQRLKAHQTQPSPRGAIKKRPVIDVRGSRHFKSMDHGGDEVDTEVETGTEDSPPPWLRECLEPVRYRQPEWEKHLKENYRGSRDMLFDTSNRLTQELWESESRMLRSVDIYRLGCDRMIDQLEGIHSEKFDQCEHGLRPIKKRFLGMFENFSKRLDNDLESYQTASANFPGIASKDQRKVTSKIDAAIEEYGVKLSELTGTT
ncbi:hypothetical protein FQN49_000888 [Arthroderma sp. PD_2]|nr:hypothetical protein FQN49_000888 [Arthroderma sp. PD_2]